MSRGHVTGRKHESPGASDWYRDVETATLRQLDAQAHADACREEAQWREARVVRMSEDDDVTAD